MSRRFVIVSGREKGRVIALKDGDTITVGRGKASTTQLNDPRISRVHCRIDAGPKGDTITDEGSTGGTFVAGKKITRHDLCSGDEIQIGETLIRYESAAAASPRGGRSNSAALSAKSLDDLVGQSVAHFKLKRIQHKGASSVLFHATDEKHSRPAVVKVMLPTVMSDDQQRDRFVRAVHTMINVRHDNLVEVYGAGKKGAFCWCAMEYVDGISIREIIELVGTGGRLDWQEVYRITVHVARALECAHRHDVIHRNVTPDNLIQRKNDKAVKLCDLMLAKALKGTQARQVTAPGQLVGNVCYMSPERTADTGNLDWRSDQYGLGATLFALLTGTPPFQSKSLPELVQAVRTRKPIFPEVVKEETPPAFQEIVLKTLEKAPENRFLYPSTLLQALDEIGNEHNVDADVLFNR